MRTIDKLAVDGGTPVRTTPLPTGKGLAVFGDEERAAALEVLESRSLFRYYGPNLLGKVSAFEAAARELLGATHAVATSSGTAALRVALAALGVGCGDEVIVPSFTFIATVNAVVCAGAVPVFAEVDDSLGLDAGDVESRITERTAAIIVVHLENTAADMEPLLAVARRRGVPVIEDTAQSMGAAYRGRALGTLGDLGAFSLQLEKNITSGEGGLVTTEDERLYLRAARYQDQGGQFITSHGGGRGDDSEPFVGENLRMTELAGAIATVQLGRLPDLLARMRANKRRIVSALGEVPGLKPRRIPDPDALPDISVPFTTALLRGQAGVRPPEHPREADRLGQGRTLELRRASLPRGVPHGDVPPHRGARGQERHRRLRRGLLRGRL